MKGVVLKSYKDISVDENGNPKKYTYSVTKSGKYGCYTESVSTCEEDFNEYTNDMRGYSFAERKCDIRSVQEKAKIMRERYNGMVHLYNVLKNRYEDKKEDCNNNDILNTIKWQIEVAKREYEKVNKQYKYMKDSFSEYTTRVNEAAKKYIDEHKQ